MMTAFMMMITVLMMMIIFLIMITILGPADCVDDHHGHQSLCFDDHEDFVVGNVDNDHDDYPNEMVNGWEGL